MSKPTKRPTRPEVYVDIAAIPTLSEIQRADQIVGQLINEILKRPSPGATITIKRPNAGRPKLRNKK